MFNFSDTIVAPSTAVGGAVAMVRLSGEMAVEIADSVFRGKRRLAECAGGQFLYGQVVDGERVIDDVVAALFRAPHSYTGEDVVEISAHGSPYIVSEIVRLLIAAGARAATAGEFTMRAFMAGRMQLVEAEAVADIVASHDRASHQLATAQMRGGYAARLAELRSRLVHLGALVELELDFGEEDVEFVGRGELGTLAASVLEEVKKLTASFTIGNALKNGIPVAIVGAPNVGKSTLLNALVGDARALVSDIAGTTRDVVEERVVIDGIEFRLSDTAGVRESADTIEKMGIERTHQTAERAMFVLLVVDATNPVMPSVEVAENQHVAIVFNKCDINNGQWSMVNGQLSEQLNNSQLSLPQTGESPTSQPRRPQGGGRTGEEVILNSQFFEVSALTGAGLDGLTGWLSATVEADSSLAGATIVSSARHAEELALAADALTELLAAIRTNQTPDLLAEHLNDATRHLGTITGEITTDELLGTIFSKFCIGK